VRYRLVPRGANHALERAGAPGGHLSRRHL
jgi:hypothetical protein